MSMLTGGPGVHGAHVTQKQGKKRDTDHAIIQHAKMEVPTAQGHLIQLHYVRYFKNVFLYLDFYRPC